MKAACTYFSLHLLLDQAFATPGLRAGCSSSSYDILIRKPKMKKRKNRAMYKLEVSYTEIV